MHKAKGLVMMPGPNRRNVIITFYYGGGISLSFVCRQPLQLRYLIKRKRHEGWLHLIFVLGDSIITSGSTNCIRLRTTITSQMLQEKSPCYSQDKMMVVTIVS